MAKEDYSKEQLFEIGKSNYEKLALHCQTLESEGLWEKPKEIMKQSSLEVLDVYVQAVLMELAVHCGNVLESQMSFIQRIPISNPFCVFKTVKLDKEFMKDVDKVYQLPPILIQLCSLYDKEKGEDITEYFLDALLNILLCMAYLNTGKNAKINEFIQKYYNKISFFVDQKTQTEHSRYIFKKLSNDKIECDVQKQEKNTQVTLPVKESIKKISTEENKTIEKKKKAGKKKVAKNFKESEDVSLKLKEELRQKLEEKRIELENEIIISNQAKEQFLQVKKRIEEREKAEEEEREKRIQSLVTELNGLVGLKNVKEEIQSLINLIKIRKLRKKMNLPEMEMTYHMVFTGSPGTGKTTVARIVAKIYKELGILSEGNLIETDRSGLVAGYVGQTAIKVHEIVEQAIGGVLFIDEAYSLINPDMPNDFGSEAVDALVKLMEDHRDNLVIIVAGYTEEMQTFLKSNSGLISRFNKFIDFPDYSKRELAEIMEVMAKNAGLEIDEGARKKVRNLLNRTRIEELKNFGNARGIRNLFEKFIMNQANRLVMLPNPTKEDLITIKKEDVVV